MIVLAALNLPAALGSIGLITALTIFLFLGARRDDNEDRDG